MSICLLSGDCRDILPTLAAESVHTVVTSPPYYALRSYLDAGHVDKHLELGSEATPEAYIAAMVGVFRQIRRVMRSDATCWVNMGDSYAGSPTSGVSRPSAWVADGGEPVRGANRNGMGEVAGYKPKDLLLMPARLALALQADGWWVRSDIIWAKPNPMPESCRDRPTSSYEHVFLLTKSARYFYDGDAVREETNWTAKMPDGWDTGTGRNLRNVWTLATHPYPDAHFATYPPALAERCIRAGTSERGCCAGCGAPWVREVETHYTPGGPKHSGNAKALRYIRDGEREDRGYKTRHGTTTGWRAGCQCGADTIPCTVLDPFAGAGTTLLVADRLQRDAVGIELNVAYTEMAMARCRADAPLFTEATMPEHPEDNAMADLFSYAAD